MRGQWSIDPWATGNQIHLMPFKGLANFKAPKEMADPQDMLAVVDNLHGILHILSIGWISIPRDPEGVILEASNRRNKGVALCYT
jgi:hypothetical protein